jgi:hypothetical protein
VGQGKYNRYFVQREPAARGAESDTPVLKANGRFVAAIEATCETAVAPPPQ